MGKGGGKRTKVWKPCTASVNDPSRSHKDILKAECKTKLQNSTKRTEGKTKQKTKHKKENRGKNLCDLVLDKDFLDKTPKE